MEISENRIVLTDLLLGASPKMCFTQRAGRRTSKKSLSSGLLCLSEMGASLKDVFISLYYSVGGVPFLILCTFSKTIGPWGRGVGQPPWALWVHGPHGPHI